MRALYLLFLSLIHLTHSIDYPPNSPHAGVDIWCGKAYRSHDTAFADLVNAGRLLPPAPSTSPLLEFTCYPRYKPTVSGFWDPASIFIIARSSHDIGVPFDFAGPSPRVKVRSNGEVLANGPVAIGRNPQTLGVDLTALPPRGKPYELLCSLYLEDEEIAQHTTHLHHIPAENPYGGSTIVLDRDDGRFYVAGGVPADTLLPGAHREPFSPVGFYTHWGDYLSQNFSLLRGYKDAGFTLVHPVPGCCTAEGAWGGLDLFSAFLDAALEIGIWVMYDLRHTFRSPEHVRAQIEAFRSHPAILLWYTADEPDGHNDPTNSTALAYDLISSLDDSRHPISMSPNCENYFFEQYASGADIVVPDAYPVGNNVSYSTVYHTPCNSTYGCCGCDNCAGTLGDLGVRIHAMRQLARWAGWGVDWWKGGGEKVFWGVVQAFGEAEFWGKRPTEAEIVEMSAKAVENGAKGLLFWDAPVKDKGIWSGAVRVAVGWNMRDTVELEGAVNHGEL